MKQKILLSLVCLVATSQITVFSQTLFGKYIFDSYVESIVTTADGSAYVGGWFNSVGLYSGTGLIMNKGTAAWDDTDVKVEGKIECVVHIPETYGGGWYIGGDFTSINGVDRNRLARINSDGTLANFDPNMNNSVRALAIDDSGNLYVGGLFTEIEGSITRNRLAKFNPDGTLSNFNPNINDIVRTLTLDTNSNLYVGGSFTEVDGTTRNHLAKFNPDGTISNFNPNLDQDVFALAVDDSNNLYVGGDFTTIGGSITRNSLAKFNSDGTLANFDPNVSGGVLALVLDDSDSLYVGGSFTEVDGTTRNRLAKFDPDGTLANFDPDISDDVRALAIDVDGSLYVGGEFTQVNGSIARNRLVKFNPDGTLSNFDPNLNHDVYALALDDSVNLYAGGAFTTIGGSITRNSLAKFNPDGTLSNFDPNVSGIVFALALDDSENLFLGGMFTHVGEGISRRRLAKYNSNGTLASFDPNINGIGIVLALDVDSFGNLYVGGDGEFTANDGDETRNHLAKFNPDGTISNFNPNLDQDVFALAVDDSDNLYVGGDFMMIGGSITRNSLAKFNSDGTLANFDPNMNSSVRALDIDNSGNLYAGGYFTEIGDSITRNSLAKFNSDGSLSDFNPNVSSGVRALTLDSSGNLYAGAGNRVVKFYPDGTVSNFDENMSNSVRALATDDSWNLHVGGRFEGNYLRVSFCAQPSIVSSMSNSRCEEGPITISAVPCEGSIKWYTTETGGAAIVSNQDYTISGNSLTINNLLETSTFYAEVVDSGFVSESRTPVLATIKTLPTSTVSQNDITLSADQIDATYQWLDCDNDNTPISDSIDQSFTPTINGNYAVEITKEGCTDTSDCIAITTVVLSNHEKLAQQVKLFPNPNNGSFKVVNETKKTLSLSIADALGKKVYSQNINTPQENISLDLPTGVYMVSFMQESNVVVKKIVVQ